MAIDINTLSAKELDALINQAKKRRTTLAKRKPIATVRNKLTQLARAEGYSVEELFGTGSSSRGEGAPRGPKAGKAAARKSAAKGSKVAPKYRNPENPDETWSGRGKQPRWLAAYTGQGRSLDEFKIQ
ncbi:H-NS family nucleoid-associated regulatory protein [Cognatilysobacter bugurensis]|uniref:DNA-binding protein n=1 Tax=Cognatilysobacter bugurensis TaxID=543356 RepID=A0A918WAI5_9GAMM|nr:H-NS histone family protein [Lysobacter bugurensis]GHA85519.1 DNA-binding protein [Lysobacter bugurensis]